MSLFQQLFDQYSGFHISEIKTNRFSAERFHEVLLPLANKFTFNHLGNSLEGRPIKSVTLGTGPVKILLWSQMHGNESTATRAILDALQFFGLPEAFETNQQKILAALTICFVPMLNPDGATKFQRRNALDIDINRDARVFVSPESQILKSIIADFKPNYAFNLHDQRRFYNITGTNKPSTIAFLAPAYDEIEAIDSTRGHAMKLIAYLRDELETIIPGQIGIYDDTYTPRAFGDYTQKEGVSTILVEAGWELNDMEKERVRKLNFCLLISAFEAIAENKYAQSTVEDYQTIPRNDERMFDLLISNITLEINEQKIKIDIGIHRREESIENSLSYYSKGQISDIGDLKDWYGFDEINGADLFVRPALVWPQTFSQWQDISREQAIDMLKQGYLFVKVQQNPSTAFVGLPINIIASDIVPDSKPIFEGMANFLLITQAGDIKYVVVNGFLWKVDEPISEIANGLVM